MAKNEVTKKKETYMTANDQQMCMGFADDLGAEDMDRTFIQLVHPQSKVVKEKKIMPGSLIRSSDNEVLATQGGDPFEFYLVGGHNYWVVKDGPTHTANYIEKKPGLTENDYDFNFKRGENPEGHHYFFHRAYVVIPKGETIPMEYSCRNSGNKDAKRFNKQIKLLAQGGTPSWGKVFTMTVEDKSNKDNEWLGVTFGVGRDTTEEEQVLIRKAWEEFRNSKEEWLKMNTESTDTEQEVEY